MKKISLLLLGGATAALVASIVPASSHADETAPVYVTKMPAGYRDWKLISVAREEGTLNDIRAVLGNDKGIKAYREGTLPFPEGTIIARIAWSFDASSENNEIFSRFAGHPVSQSFIAGPPKNGVQFMVKDSKKYAATGGWGYAQFDEGKPAGEMALKTCYPCHAEIKARDFVFTRYAQ